MENRLLQPVELKLENTALKIGDVREMALAPGEVRPVPLPYVWSRIFAKGHATYNVRQKFSQSRNLSIVPSCSLATPSPY